LTDTLKIKNVQKFIQEPDFIGGQKALTKNEELALTQYFTKKKSSKGKSALKNSTKPRPRKTSTV